MLWPCSSAVRKWMPDQTRASTISSIACDKLEKLRARPPLLVSLQAISSVPKYCWSVLTIEPLSPVCPDGCSGYGGVGGDRGQPPSRWGGGVACLAAFPRAA